MFIHIVAEHVNFLFAPKLSKPSEENHQKCEGNAFNKATYCGKTHSKTVLNL